MYEDVVTNRYSAWLDKLKGKVPIDIAEDLLHYVLVQLLTTTKTIDDIDAYVMTACFRAYTQPRSSFNKELGRNIQKVELLDNLVDESNEDEREQMEAKWYLQLAQESYVTKALIEDYCNGVPVKELVKDTGINQRTLYYRIRMGKKRIKAAAINAYAAIEEQEKTPQQLVLEEFGRYSIEHSLTKKSIHPKEVAIRIHELWNAYTGRTDRYSSGCWTCVVSQWVSLMKACDAKGIQYE